MSRAGDDHLRPLPLRGTVLAMRPRQAAGGQRDAVVASTLRMVFRVSCGLAVALTACGDTDPAAAAPKSSPTPSGAKPAAGEAPTKDDVPKAAPVADPGVAEDGTIVSAVQWFHGSLDEALTEAKTSGKLVFVDIGAYWCPPCHRLDEEVFTEASVGEFVGDGYIAVHIDAEKGEGPELVDRYKVQAYPTMLVLEASGIEKGRLVDFLPPKDFIAAMTRLAEGGNVLADLVAAATAAPDDLKAQYRLAHAYALAANREQAEAAFDVVLVGDPKNELGLASKVLYDRALFVTFKLDDKPEAAIAQFRELQKRYPDSREAVRAYAKIGRLLHGVGKSDEAIVALDAMLATGPDSASLHSSYGWFSFREHCNPKRGLEVVDAGLKLEPDNADLHYLRAELAEATGDRTTAKAAIARASALEPESAFYRRQVRRFAEPPTP